jgi:hypothetical protein
LRTACIPSSAFSFTPDLPQANMDMPFLPVFCTANVPASPGFRRRLMAPENWRGTGCGHLKGAWSPGTGVGVEPMIVETIVTTLDRSGAVNCAPMGVEWENDVLVLKPFLETATYRNVVETGTAVVNLTDDVRLFARCAISNPQYPTIPATIVNGAVLADCCSWRELEVRRIDASPPRSRIEMAVVYRGIRREFIGFNRACHAVIEAAIYATRLHILSRGFVESELVRLQEIVEKTAGTREREAMEIITDHVRCAPR